MLLQNLIKDCPKVGKSSEEYQRLEYSLKLNLRLANGRLKDMEIYQMHQNAISFQERFLDRT